MEGLNRHEINDRLVEILVNIELMLRDKDVSENDSSILLSCKKKMKSVVSGLSTNLIDIENKKVTARISDIHPVASRDDFKIDVPLGMAEVDMEEEDVLRYAFFLSKFGHEELFYKKMSASVALRYIASFTGLSLSTLRSRISSFDAMLPDEEQIKPRAGFKNNKISPAYKDSYNDLKDLEKDDIMKMLQDNLLEYKSSQIKDRI